MDSIDNVCSRLLREDDHNDLLDRVEVVKDISDPVDTSVPLRTRIRVLLGPLELVERIGHLIACSGVQTLIEQHIHSSLKRINGVFAELGTAVGILTNGIVDDGIVVGDLEVGVTLLPV